ncbi:hypothetical protein OS493_028848 [Desmophyllum pertusum]|uniref:Uncharacterized protein n=1 Tax=Desmophyllum pertusum TaxID=174260 RepID=A0A9X0D9I2_9CNID|nr:hypothetical protein OS493_028848 [Desmophyllum pertusum]
MIKDRDLTLDSVSKDGTCDREHDSNTPLESLDCASEVLLSGQEDEDEYEDEFEASFAEVVSNSTKENLGIKLQNYQSRRTIRTSFFLKMEIKYSLTRKRKQMERSSWKVKL